MLKIIAITKWLWDNKGMVGVGALIVALCLLFGIKEVQLGKARLDLATAQARVVTLEAGIKIQSEAVVQLGKETASQRAEVARLLKLVQPKAKALTDAAEAAKARTVETKTVYVDVPVEITVKQPSGCDNAIFDAATDLGDLK